MCGDSQGTTESWGRGNSARESNGAPSKRTDRRYSPSPEKWPTEQVPASSSAFLSGASLSHAASQQPLWPQGCHTSSSHGPLRIPSLCPQLQRLGSLPSLILSLVTFVISFGCNFTFLCGSLINTCFPHKITAARAQGLCLFSLRTVCSAPNTDTGKLQTLNQYLLNEWMTCHSFSEWQQLLLHFQKN